MSLKEKTVKGLTWSFIDTFAGQGITFIVGVILARILSPREFGLIGMLTIFITISQSFIDSGFGGALVRKKNCKESDFSTVFIYNLIISSIFSVSLFFGAEFISIYFNEPELKSLLKVLCIGIIINAFGIIQKTIFIKNVRFKTQSKISIISSVSSGLIAILFASFGFGVWSLVSLTISRNLFDSLLLWHWGEKFTTLKFDTSAFKEMFGFGSKLLLSGLANTISNQVYYLIIGKFFSAIELGFYTRAEQFKAIPSQNLNIVIGRVSFPILSFLQSDTKKLKQAYKRLVKSLMFITFILMFGLVAVSKNFVLTILGVKWMNSIQYLELLSFVGVFYPINALNLSILKVLGRSGLILKLTLVGKLLIIPTVFVGLSFGIKAMILMMIFSSFITFLINSYYSGRFINYPFIDQLKDISKSFLLAVFASIIVFTIGEFLDYTPQINLIIQLSIGVILIIGVCEIFRIDDYIYLKEIVEAKFLKSKK